MFEGVFRAWSVWRAAVEEDKARPRVKRNSDELEFLPAAIEIAETPASPVGRAIVLLICALFIFALVWSWFGHVDTVAVAQGRIIPGGHVKVIQPFEMGIVRTIHVREGQHVRGGQILVELDPTEWEVDRDQVEYNLRATQIDAARIEATLQAVAMGEFRELDIPEDADRDLVRMHWERMKSELAAHQAQLAALESERLRRIATRQTIEAEIDKLNATLPMIAEQEQSLADLQSRAIASRWDLLDQKQRLIESRQNLRVQKHRLKESEASISAIEKEKVQKESDFRRQLLADLVEARKRYDDAKIALRKAARREERQRLVAPVDGVVQHLTVHTLGGVVTPAEPLMIVVPDGVPLEVEAMVLNKDIGFVSAGQSAEVKVESFPFTKYGLIDGEVLQTSTDSKEDEVLGLVYPARVAMLEDEILVGERWVKLQPGMSVTAEIKTGERRLIEFFLSPFIEYQDEALRER